jgi:hypothetical protein
VITSDLDAVQQLRKPVGPRYTRDGLKCLFLLLGCKPRHAHKLMQSIFENLELGVGLCCSPRGVCTGMYDRMYDMTRQKFNEMVATRLSENSFRISPVSDELKVACRLLASSWPQAPHRIDRAMAAACRSGVNA